MDKLIAQKRLELERLEEELKTLEASRLWSAAFLTEIDPRRRYFLLDYLKSWAAEQKGHRPDCSCGECD